MQNKGQNHTENSLSGFTNISSLAERSPIDFMHHHGRKGAGPVSSVWAVFLSRVPPQWRKGSFVSY